MLVFIIIMSILLVSYSTVPATPFFNVEALYRRLSRASRCFLPSFSPDIETSYVPLALMDAATGDWRSLHSKLPALNDGVNI